MCLRIDYGQSDLKQKLFETINCRKNFCITIPSEYGERVLDNLKELLPFPEIFNEKDYHTFKAKSWWMLYEIWKNSIIRFKSDISEAIKLILECESAREIRIVKDDAKVKIYVYFK